MKRIFSTRCSEGAFSFAALILRVVPATIMLVSHGLDKLMHFSRIAPHFINPFHAGSTASLALTIFAEFFCSAFVILGLFTRLACIPLIINMCVAFFMATGSDIFGRGELAALYLVIFSAVLFFGPGKFSLDRFISK